METAIRAAKNYAAPAAQPQPYTIAERDRTRWWEVRDAADELVCLTVYCRGAREVARRELGYGVRRERQPRAEGVRGSACYAA